MHSRWLVALTTIVVLAAGLGLTAEQAPTAAELEARAIAKMQQRSYEAAADLLLEALEAEPQRASARYNLACCWSRLGRHEASALALEVAWRDGFHDLEALRSDPDLAALLSTVAGQALLDRLAADDVRRRRLAGEPLQLEARVLAGVRVVQPLEVGPGERCPLVLLLHGYGGGADGFVGVFEAAGVTRPWVFAAPFAPYPMPGGAVPGGSWWPPMTWYGDGGGAADDLSQQDADREIELIERYLLDVVDAVAEATPADPTRLVVVGFSQGGVLAYELGLDHPDRVSGTVAIGARLLPRSRRPERLVAARGRHFLILHSPEDGSLAIEGARTAERELAAAGADVRLREYAGGHSITAEVMRTAADWITALLEPAEVPAGQD